MFLFAFPRFVIKSLWQTDDSSAAQKHLDSWLQSIIGCKEICRMGDINVIIWKFYIFENGYTVIMPVKI